MCWPAWGMVIRGIIGYGTALRPALLFFQPLENRQDEIERVGVIVVIFQLQQQRISILLAAQELHGGFPIHRAALARERRQMVVVLAVVVVDVRGADALLHPDRKSTRLNSSHLV